MVVVRTRRQSEMKKKHGISNFVKKSLVESELEDRLLGKNVVPQELEDSLEIKKTGIMN